MKKTILLLATLFIGAIAFNACQKDNATEDKDLLTSEDIATNEDFSEQIDLDADVAIEDRGLGNACPTVTFAQPWGTWPNTITIDYGDNCVRPDGRVLKGKIIINQTADRFTPGAVRTKTFQNFFFDDVQVQGTKTWTNNGLDAAGLFSFTKTATDMVLSFPDGTSTSWNLAHTSTLIEGGATPTHWDNVWSTVGSSTGTNRDGESFSATISEPLIKKAFCRWISSGVVVFTRADKTASLDFGDGTCDRFGQLTRNNGNVVTVKLRK